MFEYYVVDVQEDTDFRVCVFVCVWDSHGEVDEEVSGL